MLKNDVTIESIKALGKEKSDRNLDVLLALFDDSRTKLEIRREIVSSIGR